MNQKYNSAFGNSGTGVYGEPQHYTVSTKFRF
ncbi:hypothetical protein NB311A_13956 [Nitrobacter sp. Nb-311A]|nr:hypothetical protein NB311A_13956 [Nitrobacter sp. Nb-311A]